MRIFTLANELTGEAGDNLNGKVFSIKKDPDGHLIFLDITKKFTPIWQTTSLVKEEKYPKGLILTTSSGSVYKLLDISTVLPTAPWTPYSELREVKFETMNKIKERHNEASEEINKAVNNIEQNSAEAKYLHQSCQKGLEEIDKMLDDMNDGKDDFEMPEVESEEQLYRERNYHDGWNGVVYTFKSAINKETFIEFCKRKGHRLDKLEGAAWYEDHAVITEGRPDRGYRFGDGNVMSKMWSWYWLLAYTD